MLRLLLLSFFILSLAAACGTDTPPDPMGTSDALEQVEIENAVNGTRQMSTRVVEGDTTLAADSIPQIKVAKDRPRPTSDPQ